MTEAVAILIFVAVFIPTFLFIVRRDAFVGGVYLFLFIYTVFAQIGYAYFPDLSSLINAYFGSDVLVQSSLFITLSFLAFFVFFGLFHRRLLAGHLYRVVKTTPALPPLLYVVVAAHCLAMLLYFAYHYSDLNYLNAADEDFGREQGVMYAVFMQSFKLTVQVLYVLYYLVRVGRNLIAPSNRVALQVAFAFELLLFAAIAIKLGNRTDLLSFLLAVLMLELALGLSKRKLFAILAGAAATLYMLSEIQVLRGGEPSDWQTLEALLLQDYYFPSHVLFAAVAQSHVAPLEVVSSNVANALVGLGYPYLQTNVMELFNPGIASRTASYAFYIFTEGYLVAGMAGFVYNGAAVFLGLLLWRAMASSDNRYYNLFMLGLLSTQMVNIVRGQTSYFVKDIYLVFIPAMLLLFIATGLRPRFAMLRYLRPSHA
jgi:hypothetical protein